VCRTRALSLTHPGVCAELCSHWNAAALLLLANHRAVICSCSSCQPPTSCHRSRSPREPLWRREFSVRPRVVAGRRSGRSLRNVARWRRLERRRISEKRLVSFFQETRWFVVALSRPEKLKQSTIVPSQENRNCACAVSKKENIISKVLEFSCFSLKWSSSNGMISWCQLIKKLVLLKNTSSL